MIMSSDCIAARERHSRCDLFGYAARRTPDKAKARDTIPLRSRALECGACAGICRRLFMPALHGRCPVSGGIGAVREQSYRLYSCQRCGMQVRICRRCDHGNIYCPGACAQIRRRESLRRAGRRYQRTPRGAWCHAARQRAWHVRQKQKVTHQGCTSCERRCNVSDTGIAVGESTDADHASCSDHGSRSFTADRCSFCQSILPRWTRVRAGPWLM